MHDDLIACGQEHEMKYVLDKHGKRLTCENIEEMTKACKLFKADENYKGRRTHEGFDEYLTEKNRLNKFE
jgi:hypothetical protein